MLARMIINGSVVYVMINVFNEGSLLADLIGGRGCMYGGGIRSVATVC